MAESRREIVEVVVEPSVPGGIAGIDAAESVEAREELRSARGCEVCEPCRVRAAHAVTGVEGFGGGTGVLWFEAVDVGGLDCDGNGVGVEEGVHPHCDLCGDLRCDHVVCDAEEDTVCVECGGEEGEEIMIDAEYICAVLTAVEESAGRDLWKLACAVWEASWFEGVERGL